MCEKKKQKTSLCVKKKKAKNLKITIAALVAMSQGFPMVTEGYQGTMIWLEQKLFWVFGFKSFIMLIEMQNRVGFSKLLRKNKKYIHFMLQF